MGRGMGGFGSGAAMPRSGPAMKVERTSDGARASTAMGPPMAGIWAVAAAMGGVPCPGRRSAMWDPAKLEDGTAWLEEPEPGNQHSIPWLFTFLVIRPWPWSDEKIGRASRR